MSPTETMSEENNAEYRTSFTFSNKKTPEKRRRAGWKVEKIEKGKDEDPPLQLWTTDNIEAKLQRMNDIQELVQEGKLDHYLAMVIAQRKRTNSEEESFTVEELKDRIQKGEMRDFLETLVDIVDNRVAYRAEDDPVIIMYEEVEKLVEDQKKIMKRGKVIDVQALIQARDKYLHHIKVLEQEIIDSDDAKDEGGKNATKEELEAVLETLEKISYLLRKGRIATT